MTLQPEMARQFAGLVQGLLFQALEWLAVAMEAAASPANTTMSVPVPAAAAAGSGGDAVVAVPHPVREGAKGVLLLACAARMFEQKNLAECLDGFVRALPSRDQLASLGVDMGACLLPVWGSLSQQCVRPLWQ